MAPTPVSSLPPSDCDAWADEDWIYEPKVDGYRAFVLVKSGKVQILSRNDNDLTASFPTIVAQAKRIRAGEAMIDGEIAALDHQGRVSFQALQHRSAQHAREIRFYGFDLLVRDGKDLKSIPIEERRAQLEQVIADSGLSMTVELPGTAAQALARATQFGFEGLIAKRRGSLYVSPASAKARSPHWLKRKVQEQQEFVVGGFQPDGTTVYELIVGYYDEARRLHFASKVKDGFVLHQRKELYRMLQPLLTTQCPFTDLPTSDRESSQWGGGVSAADMRKLKWVHPKRVVQIGFAQWTKAGRLRHSSYKGLRDDKTAEDVRRESYPAYCLK